jgi:hypothetical protein
MEAPRSRASSNSLNKSFFWRNPTRAYLSSDRKRNRSSAGPQGRSTPGPGSGSPRAADATTPNGDLAMVEKADLLRRSSTSCAATANKSAHNRARGTLRGCRPACRSGHGGVETRHARSETRGRPPCDRRGRIGKKGSTRSHNRSGSNVAAIRRSRYFADEDQVWEVLLRVLKESLRSRRSLWRSLSSSESG